MTATKELYHNGARCTKCGLYVGVPTSLDGVPAGDVRYPSWMQCASCGYEWDEECMHEIARAWFAHGAYEQSLRDKAVMDEMHHNAIEAAEGRDRR